MSLLDNEEELLDDSIAINWFNKHFVFDRNSKYKEVQLADDGLEIKGDVYVKSYVKEIECPIKRIYGNFDLSNSSITTLKNCPEEVYGDFMISGTWNLKSFEYSPRIVTGNYRCNDTKIENFKGITQHVGSLKCTTSYICCMEGCPAQIDGDLDMSNNINLVSLEGCPPNIGGSIILDNCNKLTSLKGLPEIIKGNLSFRGCFNLKTLNPVKEVKGYIDYTECSRLTYTYDLKPASLPIVSRDISQRVHMSAIASKIYNQIESAGLDVEHAKNYFRQ